jgi:hypothetical protein
MTRQERAQVRCFDCGEVVEAAHLDGAVVALVDHERQRHSPNGQREEGSTDDDPHRPARC